MAAGDEFEALLRTASGELSSGQRFRYSNLASTYAKYQDMWRKKLIQKESGTTQHHYGAAAKAIEGERQRKAAEDAMRDTDRRGRRG